MILKEIYRKLLKNSIFKIAGKSSIYSYVNSLMIFFQLGLIYSIVDDPQLNGLWLTIVSTVTWVYVLDFGLNNSLRNLIKKEMDSNNISKIKELYSTGFFFSSIFFGLIFILLSFISIKMDWNKTFNIDESIISNDTIVIIIIMTLFSTIYKLVLNTINSYYNNLGKNDVINLIYMASTLMSTFFIFIIYKFQVESIVTISLIYNLSNIIVITYFYIVFFLKNKSLAFDLKYVKLSYFREIYSVGLMFLCLQGFSLIIFTTDPFLISSFLSPDQVNSYQYTLKIFTMVTVFFTTLLSPFWTKISTLYNKKNYSEINDNIMKMIKIIFLMFIFLIIISFFVNYILGIMTGGKEKASIELLLYITLFITVQIWCNLFQSISNAINYFYIQLITFGIGAVVKIPLAIFMLSHINENYAIAITNILSLLPTAIFLPFSVWIFIKKKKMEVRI